jgi:hypothetical protein
LILTIANGGAISEKMTLSIPQASVGIGTTSPSALLDVTGSNGKMLIANGTSSDSMRFSAQNATGTGNAAMVFESYNSEYGRFDTLGRLLVGTATTLAQGEVIQGAGSKRIVGLDAAQG